MPPRARRRAGSFRQEIFWKKRVGLTQLGRAVNGESHVLDLENAFGENLFFAEWLRFFESQNCHFLKNENRSAAIAAAEWGTEVVAVVVVVATMPTGDDGGLVARVLPMRVVAVVAGDARQHKKVQGKDLGKPLSHNWTKVR